MFGRALLGQAAAAEATTTTAAATFPIAWSYGILQVALWCEEGGRYK